MKTRNPLWNFALAGLLTAGCNSPAPSLAPPNLQFAITDQGHIFLVHGDGSGLKEIIGGGYAQATLSPDQTKIACVIPGDFHITIFNLNAQSDLEGKPKTVYNSDSLQSSGEFGKAASPLWSPDGKKIYFLNDNHLVCYDYDLKGTTVLVDFPEGQFGRELSHCFPKEGNILYAVTQDIGGTNTIWSADLENHQPVSIASLSEGYYVNLQLPQIPEEASQNLFGSSQDPVLEPVAPPGDRFYFYVSQKESTFETSRVIAGYDKEQNLKFEVATLATYYHLPQQGRTAYFQN